MSSEIGDRQNIEFDMAMDVSLAQKSKSNLDLLIVFQLVVPFVGKSVDYITPKIHNPIDMTIRHHYIYANVSEMWIYDSKTGEVHKKLSVQN